MVYLTVQVIKWLQMPEDLTYDKHTLFSNWDIMWDLDQEHIFKAILVWAGLPTNPYEIDVDEQHISRQSSP
jgi:hypothetical protein